MGENAVSPGIPLPGGNLPWTVHLVAQAPGFDAVRRIVAVFLPQVGPVGAAGEVGILDAVHGVLGRSRTQVDGIDRFRPGLLRPLQVFVVSDVIGNDLEPGRVYMHPAFRHGADGILPLPAGHEVPARQPDRRQAGLPQRGIEILPHALSVRRRMLRVVHAAVHHGADRFQERAEQPRGNIADPVIRMQGQGRLFHVRFPLSYCFLPGNCIILCAGWKVTVDGNGRGSYNKFVRTKYTKTGGRTAMLKKRRILPALLCALCLLTVSCAGAGNGRGKRNAPLPAGRGNRPHAV